MLVTEKEVYKALGIHYKTLYQWRLRGCPVVYGTGRNRYLYDLREVKNWAKKHSRKFMK